MMRVHHQALGLENAHALRGQERSVLKGPPIQETKDIEMHTHAHTL